MYNDVHIIAYFYKWSEEAILNLTATKRKMYIEFIRKQVKAESSTEDAEDYEDYED